MANTKTQFAAAILAGVVAVSCQSVVHADPNHQVLDDPFSVYGQEFSPKLHEKAVQLYEPAKRKLLDFLEKRTKGDVQKIPPADLGTTYVMVSRLKRAAEQLQTLGEPAGADFERRADAMHAALQDMIYASEKTPATMKYIDAFRAYLSRSAAARSKLIMELEKKCREKKWEEAETDLYQEYDNLERGTVFLTPQEIQSIYSPFVNVESAIRNALSEIRSHKAKQILQAAHQATLPDYSSIVAAMNLAIEELGSKDTATWKGEQLKAEQLVVRFGDAWREAQVGALKARAIHWALFTRKHWALSEPASSGTAEPFAKDKSAEEYNAFSQQVKGCLTRLIDAEMARAKPEEIAAKYVELLRGLAPIVSETDSTEFAASVNQSLAKMVAKNPELEKQVTAYDAATSEVLRWRARIASAQAAQQATEYLPIEQRFVAGTMSQESYVGLFPQGADATRLPQLISPSPDVMKGAVPRLLGQKATVRDVVRMPGESKSAIARYALRTYAAVPAPLPLQSSIDWLTQDLLASAEPPLTLKATQALLTAQRGDFVAVGGDISGMYLEAVTTRFASMKNSAVVLTVLGQMAPEPIDTASLSHVVMRFSITPRWVQHDYFFFPLAPPTEATALR